MNEAKKLKKTNPSKAQAGPDEEIDELIMKNIAKKKERQKRRCNLCGREFKARSRFMRFCDVCKGRSEVYRFAGTFS